MNAEEIAVIILAAKTSPHSDYVATASAIANYLADGDAKHVGSVPNRSNYAAYDLGKLSVARFSGTIESRRLVMFALLLADAGNRENGFFRGFCSGLMDANAPEARRSTNVAGLLDFLRESPEASRLMARTVVYFASWAFKFGWVSERPEPFPFGSAADPRYFDEQPRFGPGCLGAIEQAVADLPDPELTSLIGSGDLTGDRTVSPRFITYLAATRTHLFEWWLGSGSLDKLENWGMWPHLIRATRANDAEYVRIINTKPLHCRFFPYLILFAERGDDFAERCREAAHAPENRLSSAVLSFLSDRFPEDVPAIFLEVLRDHGKYQNQAGFVFEKAFVASAGVWSNGGRPVFDLLAEMPYHPHYGLNSNFYSMALRALALSGKPSADEMRAWHQRIITVIGKIPDRRVPNTILAEFWTTTTEVAPHTFVDEFFDLFRSSLKSLRDIAAKGVAASLDAPALARLSDLLATGKSDQKAAAATTLGLIPASDALPVLISALTSERNDSVRATINDSIRKLDSSMNLTPTTGGNSVVAWSKQFSQGRKAAKLPRTSWFVLEACPSVYELNGLPVPQDVVSRLIEIQSKHKSIEAAPDILPLLAHLDRSRCAPFALALVEGFLNSEQAAGDRWALALAGLLGDNRIIPPLLARIPGWCDNARHKLAEYAAQAIALLPGNEPLMVLDTLANRYRNKYKNVGKACAAAFEAAATARGITPAELGDLVVPTFDFDEEGLRTFAWDGGSVAAELGPDFKLSWFDPDSDKTWSSLPTAAPAAVKDEVKLLGKLLREAVKAQTARLELALVFQRRWPVARWRELYESHPLLRCFASGLVWGVYDASGPLLRTFRRYHNGILADAAGTEEELLEADTAIGMVHPLELDEAARQAWQVHLGRLKVKQPFPQLDRPVELLDPLLANRREIAITRDKKLSAGTFRSRAEKRGWFRGSVVDAGGISSYVKSYPAVGVEVILPLDNFYIGVDPMDTIELSAAYFVRAETVQRGSYTYDEPGPDDPRVLKFAEIPAVVYSETIGDLKAIVATKE